MFTKTATLSALLAFAEARFGQEQTPVAAVSALSNFGNPGEAATLAGGIPGVLLAAANPCDKLTLADKIVSTLGTDPSVISAAAGVVGAEQNFNPFVVSVPNICGDATLPATTELRGIVPLIDPAVTGSNTENANAATSLKTPFSANGLSVADVMIAQGFSNFTVNGQAASSGNTGGAGSSGNAAVTASAAAATPTPVNCNGGAAATPTFTTTTTTPTSTATATANPTSVDCNDDDDDDVAAATPTSTAAAGTAVGAGSVSDATTGTFAGFQASSLGLDFGTCTPTVKFEESLNGRKPGEFTFQAQDPVVNKGQQEALNPNIIFNRICDQLVNVCSASDDAHTACKKAQADLGGGAKDASTANAWNTALGFDGTNINPDNAPQAGLVGHT